MRVYLAGPIAGCTDYQMHGWRERAKELRPDITFVDPTDRDYRDVLLTQEIVTKLVEDDKRDIDSCDVVLRMAEKPSEGSAQETMYAFMTGKKVVAFTNGRPPSPWLLYHAQVWDTLEDALAAL